MNDLAASRLKTFGDRVLPHTWADVYEALHNGSLIANKDYATKLKGSLSKIARLVFHLDRSQLHLIPASLELFDERVGTGPITVLPNGAKGYVSFKNRRSEARLALVHFLKTVVAPVPATPPDLAIGNERAAHAIGEWQAVASAVHAYFEEILGKNVKYKMIHFNVLKRMALAESIAPRNLTVDWVDGLLKDKSGSSTREGYIEAAKLIDTLRADPDFPQHDLLPIFNITPEQKPGIRRQGSWRPPSLTDPLDDWIGQLRSGRREIATGLFIEDKPLKEKTLTSYRSGVHWFLDSVDALGLNEANAHPNPEDIAEPALIVACIRANRNGEIPWDTIADQTLRGYVCHAIRWLEDYNPKLSKLRTRVNRLHYFRSNGPGNEVKAWCLQFMTSPKMQARFVRLPETLFDQARRAFAVYDQMNEVEKAKTINLCIAAVTAAVLTVFPLRAHTWLQLTCDTPNANIRLDPSPRSGRVHFDIPETKIKRRKEPFKHTIAPRKSFSPWEIIRWFQDGPRKELMRNHMSAEPDHTLLLCGIKYGRLFKAWSVATRHALIPMPLHRVRHAVATILINLRPDNISLVASLLGISEHVARDTYAFIDHQKRLMEVDLQLCNYEEKFTTFGLRLS